MSSAVTQSLWIPGPLPGLNDIVAAAKIGGKGRVYSSQKLNWTDTIKWIIYREKMTPVKRAAVGFRWVETARRRDPDNIMAGQKYVLDSLVRAGVLTGDGWAQIAALSHTWELGASAGVEVTLTAA